MAMNKKILIALGGNAIKSPGNEETYEEQLRNAQKTAKYISDIVRKDFRVIITHGNGPQVGDLLLQQELCKEYVSPMPLGICGAQSQAQIGIMLKHCLENAFRKSEIKKQVSLIITQVLVDRRDPAFSRPEKPIGPIYTPAEAAKLRKSGMVLKEIMAGSYRRVVPSPMPQQIIELEIIKHLFDQNNVVIAGGGGGVPVIFQKGKFKTTEAVIDKDLASQILANSLGVETFLILTNVKKVALDFRKPQQRWLNTMSVDEAKKYFEEGHFSPGSMGPKIEAAIRFLEKGGEKAIIAHLKDLLPALEGKAGTMISF